MEKIELLEIIDYMEEKLSEIKIILKKYDNETDKVDKDIQLTTMEKKLKR